MSAFVVSDYHINVIVSWAERMHGNDAVTYYWNGRSRDVRQDAKRIASVLYAENVRSVNTRYEGCDSPNGFRYKRIAYLNITPVQIIKACHCLTYQSCETRDWPETEAFAVLGAITQRAIRMMDGYDEADWELREPEKATS